ncbi:hypothetical protein Aca07nite_31620 [Actinoplanes capillaceus]|uniref:Uncharacterized protein n=1 Tax=Actinoplanes campanulatus TaxID=113559 RepID=A0ABQ3WI37_9ACTN|nr:hypothetical protein [Actinoplanes capillaceus]GID45887.1 hypothetical protein Aca07nite_31620 [Actinoplanes capillaceus]
MILVPAGFLMMLSGPFFRTGEGTPPVASLGCLVLIAGLVLIVAGRIQNARHKRATEEMNRRRMGAGWRPCPICNGSGQIVVGRTYSSPNAGGGDRAIMGKCGTCFGHGWFSPAVPGTPPPL